MINAPKHLSQYDYAVPVWDKWSISCPNPSVIERQTVTIFISHPVEFRVGWNLPTGALRANVP